MIADLLDGSARMRLGGVYDDFSYHIAFEPGTQRLHTVFTDGSNNCHYYTINQIDLGAEHPRAGSFERGPGARYFNEDA
ncbi:MAG TPA: hypothetical protein VFF38_10620 [Microvirga sp.]|nr:hypothetical protein [Microvirga sp.]